MNLHYFLGLQKFIEIFDVKSKSRRLVLISTSDKGSNYMFNHVSHAQISILDFLVNIQRFFCFLRLCQSDGRILTSDSATQNTYNCIARSWNFFVRLSCLLSARRIVQILVVGWQYQSQIPIQSQRTSSTIHTEAVASTPGSWSFCPLQTNRLHEQATRQLTCWESSPSQGQTGSLPIYQR